ncbi:hypothetical protein [Streptomyces sp.]|uniref:hypothetical protein n=1 Tax=Streptomyces sp. TaxID=1931 RepID=UPI002D76D1A1|nr:hypothetical protein [Streptomyces sp.]HET6356100.1 hypothetical protein [Streptomyces sp.]
MPVPDVRTELQIGGVWTAATVRHETRITHSRGRRNRGARVDSSDVSMTLSSPDGLYNDRNPRSPYYGQLGRNVPMRVSVDTLTPALTVAGGFSGSGATTIDAAALDIVGDIDIRFEATLDNWLKTGDVELCGKGNQLTNQRSWLLMMRDSKPHFEWSTAGTSTISKDCTAALPYPPAGRVALRVTLDVDNGASGNTVRFYTAESIAGPWVQLGADVVTAGTTSIFNSTAAVRVGDGWADLGFSAASGLVHAFELRSGIGGTVVANPNFTAQPSGTTSFVDSAGRTWTLFGTAEITSRRVRCAPEVSKWAPKWHTSGHNITSTIQAAGIKRRLEVGRDALQSTLHRRIPSEPACVAYWPMEEGNEATQAYSPIRGVPPLVVTGFDFASDDTLLGSSALPRLAGGASISMDARVPTHTDTGEWMVTYVYRFETDVATPTEILEFNTTGTVRRITVTLDTGSIVMRGYNSAGDEVITVPFVTTSGTFIGPWNRLEVIATTTGGNVKYHLGYIDVSGGGAFADQTIAATAGIVTRINTRWGASGDGMLIGHLGVFNTDNTLIYDNADDGFQGETATARITRLTGEESVPALVVPGDSTVMGAQRPNQLLDLLEECEDTDGGILYERRDRLALAYRPRVSLYNQKPGLTIDYGKLCHPFEPVADDMPRNDWEVQRIGGSRGRATLEEGRLSVQPPPDGIGRYPESKQLSLYHDGQPPQHAAWLMSLSTWDEDRYPGLRILVHKYPEIAAQVAALDVGDIIRVTGLPDHLAPGPLDLMIEGYDEKFGAFEWEITFVCSPAGPWTVGVLEDAVLGHVDTEGSELVSGVSSSATSWSVLTTAGPRWITTAEDAGSFPFDVLIGGERATVSGISGTTTTQTFTISARSVNGIVKSHSAGATLVLADPIRLAL